MGAFRAVRASLRVRCIQCFGSSFRQLKELWGNARHSVRMVLSFLTAISAANFVHVRVR
jgi:hypothetical protein